MKWSTSSQKCLPISILLNLKSIEEEKNVHLEVPVSNIHIAVTGDGCVVNVKGSKLLDEIYGIKSPSSICAF